MSNWQAWRLQFAMSAAKAQSAKPQNALEVREQHLDLLARAPRLRERLSFGEGTGDIACGFVHITDDPSRGHVRAALRFERAGATLRPGAEIPERIASRGERLSRRTCVDVAYLVVAEVLAASVAVGCDQDSFPDRRGSLLLERIVSPVRLVVSCSEEITIEDFDDS